MQRLQPPTAQFQDSIRGLVRVFVAGEAPEQGPVVHRVATLMTDRIAAMPWIFSWGVAVLTIWFELSAFFRYFRSFGSLDAQHRARHVRRWRESRLGLCRDLVDLYERMLCFLYYSQPEVQQHLGSGERVV